MTQPTETNDDSRESRVKTPITVAYGDGIGPEIMEATLRVLEAAGAQIEPEVVRIGEQVYEQGITAGIEPAAWDSLRKTQVFLKAPITTPQGGGYKSLNVTTRKTLGLYANVRPCRSFAPFVQTVHPGMDVVVVRENEEDTYGGIEHQQTREVTQCLKLITRPGCEKIVRYAFEYAKQNGRKRVTCFTKDNIHKLTDGLFHRVFDEIATEYPEIENEHWIIDIGAALLADQPERFDVIVTLNLYGDIISDVAAQITGSVGLGGSANVGETCAMFEAIHGSAPTIAGQGIANPSGLLLSAVMMLVHINQPEAAEKIHNAWLVTLEQGMHTRDIYEEGSSQKLLGTKAFADAVIANLGLLPTSLPPVKYKAGGRQVQHSVTKEAKAIKKELLGVDVFLDWDEAERNSEVLGKALQPLAGPNLRLKMITNRGVKVFPDGLPETFCTDHWRCRFTAPDGSPIQHAEILDLLQRLNEESFDFIKTENLYSFDGERGYSLGQGE